MGSRIMKDFDSYITQDNIAIMRKHLESSSYVSGSHAQEGGIRRGRKPTKS